MKSRSGQSRGEQLVIENGHKSCREWGVSLRRARGEKKAKPENKPRPPAPSARNPLPPRRRRGIEPAAPVYLRRRTALFSTETRMARRP
ncbi:unnamed protein product, partial [Iphiclides podalirius]